MANSLYIQGMDPIPLHESESFNKVRKRIVEAQAKKIAFDADPSDTSTYVQPGDLSFKVDMGDGDVGRIAVSVDKIIAVTSDEPKDGASRAADEDDDE